jgi:hypothetical protein
MGHFATPAKRAIGFHCNQRAIMLKNPLLKSATNLKQRDRSPITPLASTE